MSAPDTSNDPETRLNLALNIVVQNVEEVKNDIGGVIGYTLSLDMDQTRTLWNLLQHKYDGDG